MIPMIDLITWTNKIPSSPIDAAALLEDSAIWITSKNFQKESYEHTDPQ